MNAFRTLLILVASLALTAHSQQPKPAPNILEGKNIEELRKIAKDLGGGKSSFEFVEAAYASGRDDIVALCWSVDTCGIFCFERLRQSQDPVFRDKQVLMMLRNGGADSCWPGSDGVNGGSQLVLMETLGRLLAEYVPDWTTDYSLLNTPEKRLAFADKLEVLMKTKHEKDVQPALSPAPSTAAPPKPVPTSAPPPKSPVAVPPMEKPKPVAWIPWVSIAAALLIIVGFLVLRRRKK